jgi:hypothetical protein
MLVMIWLVKISTGIWPKNPRFLLPLATIGNRKTVSI